MIFTGNTDYDVIVIGGRPAGSTLAARLGKQGLRVLMVERASFPSLPAVSSPIIYASTMSMLDEIGAREDEYARNTPKIRTMVQALGEVQAAIEIPDYKGRNYGYAVDRARFDHALWEAALRFPTVTGWQNFSVRDLLWDESGQRVTGIIGQGEDKQEKRITASLVVGADGRFSLVARKTGAAESDIHEEFPTTLYYAYWENVGPFSADSGPTAAAYGGEQAGIGYLVMDSADNTAAVVIEGQSGLLDDTNNDTEGFYLSLLAQQPMLMQRLENAHMVTTVRGMKRVGNLYRQPGGEGWALVGDAYHQKDPLDGQGIYNAVFSAKALAAAIKKHHAGDFDWPGALEWYDETVRIKTYSAYQALIQRVQGSIYAAPAPDWLMRTVGKWIFTDPDLTQLFGRSVVRSIPSDVLNVMAPGYMARALVRGSLRDLRDQMRTRVESALGVRR